jgi:hypothetical protein
VEGNFTLNDMQKLGRSIFGSTYLSPGTMKRWLKPRSFSADPRSAIGAPFEMLLAPGIPRVQWIYTKAGDIDTYNTLVGYMPEYNVGFTILAAFLTGKTNGIDVATLGNAILNILVRALESAARLEASQMYAGTYRDAATNSSITVATDALSALNLVAWTTSGTYALAHYSSFFSATPDKALKRLNPAGLSNVVDGVTTAVAFRLVVDVAVLDNDDLILSFPGGICFQWVQVDPLNYGTRGLDSFVFG